MDNFVSSLISWFALPEHGLASVFVVALVSATLLPLGSEPAVFGYVKLNPDHYWIAVLVATVGNTLGGVIDYWMGRAANKAITPDKYRRFFSWFERMGPRVLIFGWVPGIGDPLCTVAGWLQMSFWPCVVWMTLGKFLRYTIFTALLLWVPDAWWMTLLRPFLG